MKSKLNLNILKIAKFLSLFFSTTYLLLWCVQFLSTDLSETLAKIFMTDFSLPGILDKTTFSTVVEINRTEGSMAYIHAAVVTVVATYFFSAKLKKIETEIADRIEEEEFKKREKKQSVKVLKEKKEEQKNIILTNTFYGLFEINLSYVFETNKSESDLQRLKNEYFKMITRKVKNKYPNIKFAINNKIFIVAENFSDMEALVFDMVRVYKVLLEIDTKKMIKTELIFALWMNDEPTPAKFALEVLTKINALRHVNKVVVTSVIQKRYEKQLNRKFSLLPMGEVYLMQNDETQQDIQTELFELKSNK